MKTDDWAVVEQALRNAKSMVTQDCDAQAMLDGALEALGRLREDLALLRA